jgi:hypothetical protein
MDTTTRAPAKTAAEVGKLFPLGDGMTPRQSLDVLLEKPQYLNTVRFLILGCPTVLIK